MAPTTPVDVIDVNPPSEDEQFAMQAGSAVQAFLGSLRGFFSEAMQIESAAKTSLSVARAMKEPTTADEDAEVQTFTKGTSVAIKAAESHWEFRLTVHQFHRRLTAALSRSTDALTEANSIGNNLHNAYVVKERRRAAAETEWLRIEAVQVAAAARQKELDLLARQADDAEAASADLSEREQTFVDLVFAHGDAMKAAKTAGYKNPLEKGAQLMTVAKIQAAVQAKQAAAALRSQAAARKAAPLEIESRTVQPDIQRGRGVTGDRTTWGAEVMDEAKLIEAVFAGTYGIPRDVLMVNPAKVRDYGKSMHELIDRWPGVRHTKITKTV